LQVLHLLFQRGDLVREFALRLVDLLLLLVGQAELAPAGGQDALDLGVGVVLFALAVQQAAGQQGDGDDEERAAKGTHRCTPSGRWDGGRNLRTTTKWCRSYIGWKNP